MLSKQTFYFITDIYTNLKTDVGVSEFVESTLIYDQFWFQQKTYDRMKQVIKTNVSNIRYTESSCYLSF